MRWLGALLITYNFLKSDCESASPPCHLPSGKPGLCVPITGCTHLTDLIQNLPREVSSLIRDSFFCGYAGKTITVCCPTDGLATPPQSTPRMAPREECGLQNDKAAECTTLSNCEPLHKMLVNLKRPFPASVPSIMKSSYLCGVERVAGRTEHKVCCPATSETSSTTTSAPTPTEGPDESAASVTENTRGHYSSHPGISSLAQCGKVVAGGAPWVASLGYALPGQEPVLRCEGSLIGPRYVLTAATCVHGMPALTLVRLGDQQCTAQGGSCSQYQDVGVERVVIHEHFANSSIAQHNIALIKLSSPV